MVTPLRAGAPPFPTERSLRLPEGAQAPVQGRGDQRPEPGIAVRTPAQGLAAAGAGPEAKAAAADPTAPVRMPRPGSLIDIRI